MKVNELAFSHPVVNRIVKAAFPEAKTRRPVKILCRNEYKVADYWDGGSRDYCVFVRLSDMSSHTSESIPRAARQQTGNPFNLPIATVIIQPGFVVVEHSIFRGKDFGYRIMMNDNDIALNLPEVSHLLPTNSTKELIE